jgi:hypothetical protein
MSAIRTIILLLHRLTIFITRKLLHLILPYSISVFPTPSFHLANLFGINPLAIKPKRLPLPPLIQNISNLGPLPLVNVLDPFNLMGKQQHGQDDSPTAMGAWDPTQYALRDKIRTWGQRNRLVGRLTGEKLEQTRKAREMIDATILTTTTQLAPPPKPKKKDVNETPIEGMNRIVAEGLDNLGRVLPKYPNPFPLFLGLN